MSAESVDILLEEEEQIQQRMESLEKRKIICGYHTVINWDKASRNRQVMAIIEVGVTPQRDYGYDKIARTIARYPEVDTMYLLSGKSEFMCMVYGKSMYDVASFVADKIACIESVKSTVTLFVLKQYKESGIILEDERKDAGERLVVTP
ncbi:MAG: Lrp/AsnC family transcriptional regulator [Merdibacter sp.]